MRSSQQRIDCTANSAVSLVIPTLTKPALAVTSYTPYGHDLAERLVLEVMHVHAPWIAFRTIIGSAILEVADQLLLLRIDGDDGLLLGLRGNDFRVDIFELGIAIGVFRALMRLAIGLAREPKLHQLLAHRIGTDWMPHLRQCRSQFLHAFRHPDQRPHGIAQRRGLHKSLKGRDESWIVLANRATPAAGTANSPLRQWFRIQISLAATDRGTGQPGDLRDDRENRPNWRSAPRSLQTIAALARRASSRPPPTAAEWRPRQSRRRPTPVRRVLESPRPESLRRMTTDCDSVIVQAVLSVCSPQVTVPASPYRGVCSWRSRRPS